MNATPIAAGNTRPSLRLPPGSFCHSAVHAIKLHGKASSCELAAFGRFIRRACRFVFELALPCQIECSAPLVCRNFSGACGGCAAAESRSTGRLLLSTSRASAARRQKPIRLPKPPMTSPASSPRRPHDRPMRHPFKFPHHLRKKGATRDRSPRYHGEQLRFASSERS